MSGAAGEALGVRGDQIDCLGLGTERGRGTDGLPLSGISGGVKIRERRPPKKEVKSLRSVREGTRVTSSYLVRLGADDVVAAVDDRHSAVGVPPPHLGRLGPGVHGTLQRDRGSLWHTHHLPRPDLGPTCTGGRDGRQEVALNLFYH